MKRGLIKCLAILAISVASGSVYALDEDLTQLSFEKLLETDVLPASKLASQISDAPSAVVIVTAQDIHDYGYRTLADIFNSMRGLYTTYDRAWQYLGGRGFGRPGDYAGRIMIMIDGYATNENIYNQAYIDNAGFLDTALIERVEYVPGTGSVLYGNNAYFGIINIITKKGRAFDGAQVAGSVMSYGGKKGRATYGQQLDNGADVLVSASWLDSDGQNLYFPEFDSPATNNGVARNLDYERSKRVFGKLHYQGLTVEGGYVDHKKGIPTAAYGVDFNAYNQYWDNNGFLSANYDTNLNPRLKSSTHAYYGNYLDRGAGFYTVGGMWREHNLGQWWGIDQKLLATWFDGHKIIFGAEYRDDFQMDLSDPAGSSSHSRITASLYGQDEITLNEQWKVNVGARYDHASDVGGNVSPRLALIYSPVEQTQIKASYSSAFRLPAAYEKYYTDRSQTPNPRLQPEYVTTTELVLEHRFSPDMRFTGSVYRYRTRDLITNVDDVPALGLNQYVNVGSSHTKGVELEMERIWGNGARMRGSYAWQEAIDQNGRHMINSPHNLAKLNLSFPMLQQAVRTGLELQYTGARLTENQVTLGGYTLANLTFTADHFLRNLSASASIRNLFDHRYDAVAPGGFTQDSFEMDGRNYWLQLQYDFR
jgi:iron complex outermembrane receptor protein